MNGNGSGVRRAEIELEVNGERHRLEVDVRTTHVTVAAQRTGRPVRLDLTRRQLYHSVGYRPHTEQRVALGAMRCAARAGPAAPPASAGARPAERRHLRPFTAAHPSNPFAT
jgi:hypothetical protein